MVAGWYLSVGFLTRGNSHTALNALAKNLIADGQFAIVSGVPSIEYEPAYPVLIAIAFTVFGVNWFGILLLQASLHGATSWLIFKCGDRLGNRDAGFMAACMHAFYPFLFLHTLSIIDSTIFVFCIVAVICSTVGCWNRSAMRDYLSLGFAGALALLTRGAFVAFGPAFAAMFVAAVLRHRSRGAIWKAMVCAAVAAALLGPWVVRNYRLTGKILISTHGPFGLWQGNNPYSLDLIRDNVSLDEVYRRDPAPEIYQRYPLRPNVPRHPVDSVAAANAYAEETKRFIKENPTVFVQLAAWKFAKFWSPFYNPISKEYAYGGALIRQVGHITTYLPILVLSIPGAFVLHRQHQAGTWLLLGLVGFYTIAHMIAMGYSRLRLPLDPILMIFAAHFLVSRFPALIPFRRSFYPCQPTN